MKRNIIAAIAIVVAAASLLLFSACAGQKSGNGDTAALTDKPASDATEAKSTEAGSTEAAAPTDIVTEKPTEVITDAPTEEPTPSPLPTAANIAKGTNVALDAEVDVSSTTGAGHVQWGWSYEYINDGYIIDDEALSYGWTTAVGVNMDDPDQQEWVEFLLDKYTSVDTVILYPTIYGSYFPVNYEIQVSMDGKDYTTVAKVEGDQHALKGDTTPVKLEFEAVTCRYVRFLATRLYDVPSSLGDGILCQMAEIEIYAA